VAVFTLLAQNYGHYQSAFQTYHCYHFHYFCVKVSVLLTVITVKVSTVHFFVSDTDIKLTDLPVCL